VGQIIWAGLAMGLGATLLMDIWALTLNRLAGQPLPNWALVGRWAGHIPRGRLFHPAIGEAVPVERELALGWAVHYGVGLIYGLAFALIVGPGWLAAPSFLPAWIWGIVTIAGGWLLLHPGMGLGWAVARTERPWKTRAMGLLAHTVFGTGLWLTALMLPIG
jgi:hypothetical protein